MTILEKEKIAKKGLEELIKKDKKNNDEKSLKYHQMALDETRKNIEKLEKKYEN